MTEWPWKMIGKDCNLMEDTRHICLQGLRKITENRVAGLQTKIQTHDLPDMKYEY